MMTTHGFDSLRSLPAAAPDPPAAAGRLRRGLAIMALGTLATGLRAMPVVAQINAIPTIPPTSTGDDVDEVEEIAPDSAYLPAQDAGKGAAPISEDPLVR